MKIKMKVTADMSNGYVDEIEYNASEQYPEFHFECIKRTEFKNGNVNYYFNGEMEDTEENRRNFGRLTHHAEGLYENSDAENVHVEVYFDGKWYGR